MATTKIGSRRQVLAGLGGIGVTVVVAGAARTALAALAAAREEDTEQTPIEDFMREHALLERVLLVYEESARRIEAREDISPDVVSAAAGVVRRYIEDHHERDEEIHVFPRVEQTGRLNDLVATLRDQHAVGRRLTTMVQGLGTFAALRAETSRELLVRSLRTFVRVYRPHAAHENTVLFPAFRAATSSAEYERLRERLEENEQSTFGADLYERTLAEVLRIERALGIDALAGFTPAVWPS